MSCLQAEAISPLANDHGACWSRTVGFNPLNRQTMEEAGRVAWHLTPLIARPWGCWSRSVAFNPLIARPWGGWSRSVAFNPLIARTWGHSGQVPWYLTPLFARPWGMLVAYPGI
ncbi:hypothetical protein [Escherichia coli]|uniref:hypothetical protein n=1 Tax=Escherichia coli TaxID=562 RepID=UPI001553EF98|nr:hypothetical protein [Escherichia coli]